MVNQNLPPRQNQPPQKPTPHIPATPVKPSARQPVRPTPPQPVRPLTRLMPKPTTNRLTGKSIRQASEPPEEQPKRSGISLLSKIMMIVAPTALIVIIVILLRPSNGPEKNGKSSGVVRNFICLNNPYIPDLKGCGKQFSVSKEELKGKFSVQCPFCKNERFFDEVKAHNEASRLSGEGERIYLQALKETDSLKQQQLFDSASENYLLKALDLYQKIGWANTAEADRAMQIRKEIRSRRILH